MKPIRHAKCRVADAKRGGVGESGVDAQLDDRGGIGDADGFETERAFGEDGDVPHHFHIENVLTHGMTADQYGRRGIRDVEKEQSICSAGDVGRVADDLHIASVSGNVVMTGLIDGGGIRDVEDSQSARAIRHVREVSRHRHSVSRARCVVIAQDVQLRRIAHADDLQSAFAIREINQTARQIEVVSRARSIRLADGRNHACARRVINPESSCARSGENIIPDGAHGMNQWRREHSINADRMSRVEDVKNLDAIHSRGHVSQIARDVQAQRLATDIRRAAKDWRAVRNDKQRIGAGDRAGCVAHRDRITPGISEREIGDGQIRRGDALKARVVCERNPIAPPLELKRNTAGDRDAQRSRTSHQLNGFRKALHDTGRRRRHPRQCEHNQVACAVAHKSPLARHTQTHRSARDVVAALQCGHGGIRHVDGQHRAVGVGQHHEVSRHIQIRKTPAAQKCSCKSRG